MLAFFVQLSPVSNGAVRYTGSWPAQEESPSDLYRCTPLVRASLEESDTNAQCYVEVLNNPRNVSAGVRRLGDMTLDVPFTPAHAGRSLINILIQSSTPTNDKRVNVASECAGGSETTVKESSLPIYGEYDMLPFGDQRGRCGDLLICSKNDDTKDTLVQARGRLSKRQVYDMHESRQVR
jgi:hypothetical protein